jgi:hypothetical protein
MICRSSSRAFLARCHPMREHPLLPMSPGSRLATPILFSDTQPLQVSLGMPRVFQGATSHNQLVIRYEVRNDTSFVTKQMDMDLRLLLFALLHPARVTPILHLAIFWGIERSETADLQGRVGSKGATRQDTSSETGRHPWGPDILLQLDGRLITDHHSKLPASFRNLMTGQ